MTDESLTFGEFNLSNAIASVKSGQPVIPLWLNRIHQRLRLKLAEMGKIEAVEALESKKFASMSNETNTCRQYVEPKLREAGWESEPHDYTEQYYFTAGKIQPKNRRKRRGKRKFVDYLLLYKSEYPIAVVEAKKKAKTPDEGLEQAIDYAKLLGVKFAYSTNGKGIVEFDFITGKQSDDMETFPTPSQLWARLTGEEDEQIKTEVAEKLVTSMFPTPDKPRNDNVDTYRFFGNPLYTYSLKEGIEDGFLAPYRVYRVTTRSDKEGWQPSEGQLDRYGRTVHEGKYLTPDFERRLVRDARTKAIAQHLTDFLKATDRYAKTIVFCVDEEHIKATIKALRNLNTDITKDNPNYITRITSDAGVVGKGHLDDFKDVENKTHIIAVTSKLLTTGVDIPTCKNIVLARVIRSMSDFKQIIGRGTRVREEYDKISFNIIDYTKSTVLFEDPDFDGEPALIKESEIDDEGKVIKPEVEEQEEDTEVTGFRGLPVEEDELPYKYYVDGGTEEIVEEQIYDPDAENQLRLSKLIDYTKEQVRILYRSTLEIQQKWADPDRRSQVIELLEEKGIDFEELKEVTNQPEADPFDLICHIAFDAPVLTYKQRVERLKRRKKNFFEQYGEDAREILEILLDKYAEHGVKELEMPTTFKANREFDRYGNVREIAERFGGIPQLKEAVYQLQNLLYSA